MVSLGFFFASFELWACVVFGQNLTLDSAATASAWRTNLGMASEDHKIWELRTFMTIWEELLGQFFILILLWFWDKTPTLCFWFHSCASSRKWNGSQMLFFCMCNNDSMVFFSYYRSKCYWSQSKVWTQMLGFAIGESATPFISLIILFLVFLMLLLVISGFLILFLDFLNSQCWFFFSILKIYCEWIFKHVLDVSRSFVWSKCVFHCYYEHTTTKKLRIIKMTFKNDCTDIVENHVIESHNFLERFILRPF